MSIRCAIRIRRLRQPVLLEGNWSERARNGLRPALTATASQARRICLFLYLRSNARRWERNLKIQTILPLALASLVSGCGGQMSSNEAGLLDAVAFIIGGQQEGAIPQGFETHWRRTVHGREIKYQSNGAICRLRSSQ